MPTEKLCAGMPTTIVQNTIYALPARKATLHSSDTTPTIQQSNVVAFSNSTAVTLTDGQATVSGGFIRCTSGSITLTLKHD